MDKRFGLLGRKLGHSWSPQIHQLLCGYPYGLYEVEPEDLADFLRTTDLAGMNVTIPYKKAVLPFCTSLSDAARRIGSVNTLVRTAEGWHGDNTDHAGFLTMAALSGVPIRGRKVLVFGTGGASLAVIAALRDMGAGQIVNISRSGPDNYRNLDRHADAQVLVNTTPLGMFPEVESAPVHVADFPACEGVLDVVYNPIRTALLLDARAHGLPCAGGLMMLVAQARSSAQQFAGTDIPDSRVDEIAAVLRRQMTNIVLVGMPGCGKSSIGKALARRLERTFMDSDEYIAQSAGMPVPEIIAREGEAGFRARETAALKALGMETGAVLATGGGCVTRPENEAHLRRSGVIFWIRRDLSLLPTEGRPLSQRTSPLALYEARKDAYAAFADHIIENDGSVEEAVDRILEVFSP